jgi:hypothetical protein
MTTQTLPTPNKESDNNQPIENKEYFENKSREIGGPKGLEPTRYGDWEKGGRCIDF